MPVDYTCSNFELCRRILAHEISHHIKPHNHTSIILLSARLHEDLHGTKPWQEEKVQQDDNACDDVRPGLPATVPSISQIRLRLRGTVVARVADVTPCLQMIAPSEISMLPDTVFAGQDRVPPELDAEYTFQVRRAVDLVGLLPSVHVSDVSYGIGSDDINLTFVVLFFIMLSVMT